MTVGKIKGIAENAKTKIHELNNHAVTARVKKDVHRYWRQARKSSKVMYVAKGAGLGALVGIPLPIAGPIAGAVLGALTAGGILLYRHILDQSRPPKSLSELLSELKEILDQGMITQEEYEQLRKKLVAEHL